METTLVINNVPNADDLWAGIGGHFDNLGQIINEFLDNSISNFAGNRCDTRNIIIRLKELEANGDVRISRGFRNRNKNVERSIFVGEQVRCGVST